MISHIHKIHKIPEFRKNDIITMYNASQHTLGIDTRLRQRILLSTLRIYYPWENKETIKYMFDDILKPLEIKYITKFYSKNIKKNYGKMVKKLFGSMDADDNGTIDFNEFKYAVRNIDNIDSINIFNKADINNDGVLDIDEFYNLVASTPLLRNNFDLIIINATQENTRKEFEQRSRIFKNDISERRPSLSDLRSFDDICSFDIPLYNISPPFLESSRTKRQYG